MRCYLPAAAILLLLANSLHAQDKTRFTLRGRVLDTTTESPVPVAIVRDFTTHRVVIADSLGQFVFTNLKPGAHQLEVARLGYITVLQETELNAGDTLLVKLYPQPVILAGITAVAKRLEVRVERMPFMVRVMDDQKLHAAVGNMQDFLATRAFMHFTPCPPRAAAMANSRLGMAGGLPDVGAVCIYTRGRTSRVSLFVDENAVASDFLDIYYPDEFERAEYYAGLAMVRLYTPQFIQRVAAGKAFLSPIIF